MSEQEPARPPQGSSGNAGIMGTTNDQPGFPQGTAAVLESKYDPAATHASDPMPEANSATSSISAFVTAATDDSHPMSEVNPSTSSTPAARPASGESSEDERNLPDLSENLESAASK